MIPYRLPAAAQCVVLAAAVAPATGCSKGSAPSAGKTDTTGTVVDRFHGEFVHGYSPFYGSAVRLIPVTPATERWWLGFARPRLALIDPSQASSIGIQARTTAAQDGSVSFDSVPPGRYYVYGRVLWASTAKDTTSFGGDAWLGTASVAARETTDVVLRNR